jgi:hypothetical protein
MYFKKVQFGMPFFAGGKRVQFEPLDNNIGVIALTPGGDNDVIRDALHKASEVRKGGVVEITSAQYEELKKKLPLPLSAPKRKPMLQVWDRRGPRVRPQAASRSDANAAVGTEGKTLTASSTPGSVGSGIGVGGGGAPAGPGAPLNPATRRLTKGPVMRKPKVGDFRNDAIVVPTPA